MEISIMGRVCRYEQEGQGRDVLLLHGWGGSVDSWIPIFNHLKGECRVTAIDFPGHGGSGLPDESGWSVDEYAAFTAEFMEKIGISGCDIIAHSFGGRVAIKLAAERPQLVGRLLLTGAAGLKPRRGAKYYIKTYTFKALKRLTYLLPGGARLREKLGGRFGSADYRALPPAMRATFVKVVNQDLAHCLPHIKAETLLVWGRSDTATPLWMGQEMEKHIKGSALIVLEDAGHFAYLDQCDRFLRILDAFLFPKEG